MRYLHRTTHWLLRFLHGDLSGMSSWSELVTYLWTLKFVPSDSATFLIWLTYYSVSGTTVVSFARFPPHSCTFARACGQQRYGSLIHCSAETHPISDSAHLALFLSSGILSSIPPEIGDGSLVLWLFIMGTSLTW